MLSEYSFARTAKSVGDSVGRRQESICMKTDAEVTKLNKVAERILDSANGKPSQRQCRALVSELICGLLIASLRSCLKLQREYSIKPLMIELRGVIYRLKRTGPRAEPCGTPQVRGDEGELCVGIPILGARDERYVVNHCSETEAMPNQKERRCSRMEWSRVSKAADRSRRQRQEIC